MFPFQDIVLGNTNFATSRKLYPGSGRISKLSFIMKLLHIKLLNGWSNKSFDMLLQFLKEILPSDAHVPKTYYESKKIIRELGMKYEKIDVCKNDCVLYWNDLKEAEDCPVCGLPRFQFNEKKAKKIPQKILRYFPLKPRLQRLFVTPTIAEDMTWHEYKREKDGIYRHPADSKEWKHLDELHVSFASDPHNVRLGLASDGFNPFDNMSNSYSMWPVILVPYNLPPWRCMKDPFFMLSLLIPGPKAPGNDIDVFLQPLVNELKELWDVGVTTYDASVGETFQLHAALLWTINDFPAYANLSGWSTKGKLACPVCNEDTYSMSLKHGNKICFMGHRRFLPNNHKWRKCKWFDGKEHRPKPNRLNGEQVLQQLSLVEQPVFGKAYHLVTKRKRPSTHLNWTKKSIFFELPYWKTLTIRHNLDVMHIEKNVCDSVLGTLLNINGKTKDTYKARLDLEYMGIRKELHPIRMDGTILMPHACYVFNNTERMLFCKFLQSIKLPDGTASNISRCVNTKDWSLRGLKSHDCHVILQRLLPLALRGCLRKDVSKPLIELSIFFKELTSRSLNVEVLEQLERNIAIILCKLEQIFPPAFFDVMVRLTTHLASEAIRARPVQFRWMYPFERYCNTPSVKPEDPTKKMFQVKTF